MKSVITQAYIDEILKSRGTINDLVLSGEDPQIAGAIVNSGVNYDHLKEIKSIPELQKLMLSKWWRLNNLYHIIDKNSNVILFRCKKPQKRLFKSMWYRVLILKARQLGYTTLVSIYFLDDCLFNSHLEANIIAHRLDDSKKIFRRKVKFAYDNLPPMLKSRITLAKEAADELVFSNGSSISVTVSSRSGNPQRLHVSEYGKICAKFPEKAREIVTGALQAVAMGGIAIFESTAEGNYGDFYDKCEEARKREQLGRKPTSLEFKFFFASWWEEPEYSLPEDQYIPIPEKIVEYFDNLEKTIGRKLTQGQRCWWYSQYKILGADMYRENPSTPEEAWLKRIVGAYFVSEFDKIRAEKRICSVPYEESCLVDTWWDLGMNDIMAIWFTQDVGREIHVIDYFENSGEGFSYYKNVLDKKGYRYGRHYAPHDIAVRELGTGESRLKTAATLGINFDRVPRVADKQDAIQAARTILGICWFDEGKCDLGLKHLENYRKEWDEHLQTYKKKPLHDSSSNAADAFQTLGMGHKSHLQVSNQRIGIGVINQQPPPPGGWT